MKASSHRTEHRDRTKSVEGRVYNCQFYCLLLANITPQFIAMIYSHENAVNI